MSSEWPQRRRERKEEISASVHESYVEALASRQDGSATTVTMHRFVRDASRRYGLFEEEEEEEEESESDSDHPRRCYSFDEEDEYEVNSDDPPGLRSPEEKEGCESDSPVPHSYTPRGEADDESESNSDTSGCRGSFIADGTYQHRPLFATDTYQNGIIALSEVIVQDHATVRVIGRSISMVSFECLCRQVTYALKHDCDSSKWCGFRFGIHNPQCTHNPKPLKEHVDWAIARAMSERFCGNDLIKRVRELVNVQLPATTILRKTSVLPEYDWKKLWRQVPAFGRKLKTYHLRYQDFRTKGEQETLDAFAFELPAIRFCKTAGFLGVIFADGTNIKDKMHSTMLIMATMTADHITLPLAALIGPREDELNYQRLFEFAKPALPDTFTLLSDQHPGAIAGFKKVFGLSKDIHHLFCYFHIAKNMRKDTAWELLQILKADHPTTYKRYREVFASSHRREFNNLDTYINQMSYMSEEYQGVFELVADSPIESVNAAVKRVPIQEPLYVALNAIKFTKSQIDAQLNRLQGRYCPSCLNTLHDRETKTGDTPVRKGQADQFIATGIDQLVGPVEYELIPAADGALTCTCKGYDRMGIPCRHMIAVQASHRVKLPEIRAIHCSATIRASLTSIPAVQLTLAELDPENVGIRETSRKPGRPRKTRMKPFREYLVKATRVKCSACGAVGHTKRSKLCPKATKPTKASRKRKQHIDNPEPPTESDTLVLVRPIRLPPIQDRVRSQREATKATLLTPPKMGGTTE